MKNYRISFLSLAWMLLALPLFIACNKDDDDDNPPRPDNYIEYDGKYYALTQGYIENWGEMDPGVYNLDLTLLSSGFTINYTGTELSSIAGTGDAVYFEIYTADSNQIVPGTYTFNANSTAAGVFDEGFLGLGVNFGTLSGTFHTVTSGTVSIQKDGAAYTVSFNMTDETGKAIKGYFKKELVYLVVDWKSGGPVDKRKPLGL